MDNKRDNYNILKSGIEVPDTFPRYNIRDEFNDTLRYIGNEKDPEKRRETAERAILLARVYVLAAFEHEGDWIPFSNFYFELYKERLKEALGEDADVSDADLTGVSLDNLNAVREFIKERMKQVGVEEYPHFIDLKNGMNSFRGLGREELEAIAREKNLDIDASNYNEDRELSDAVISELINKRII